METHLTQLDLAINSGNSRYEHAISVLSVAQFQHTIQVVSLLFSALRSLQVKLDQPVSEPPSPRSINDLNNGDTAANLANNIQALRSEVTRYSRQISNLTYPFPSTQVFTQG